MKNLMIHFGSFVLITVVLFLIARAYYWREFNRRRRLKVKAHNVNQIIKGDIL